SLGPRRRRRFFVDESGLCRFGSVCYFASMNYSQIITMESGKRGGRPCVRGLRISVGDVLGWLAAGMSVDEIKDDYPEITEEDIRACLAFAADKESGFLTPLAA
ncbi:MAG: DUF433 domain-containing protein, partial [Prosthecobacter sp.]|nr:DUF433 domain-containing protein [Prosthecobacter sp.]